MSLIDYFPEFMTSTLILLTTSPKAKTVLLSNETLVFGINEKSKEPETQTSLICALPSRT